MKRNKIVCIVGPSGVGKTTLVRRLASKSCGYDKHNAKPAWKGLCNFQEVISTTTREPRAGETNGVDYHFVTKKSVEETREEFIELVEYHGNYYGLRMDDFMRPMMAGNTPIVVVERAGVRHLEEVFGTKWIMPVLILPPSPAELRSRLENSKSRTPEEIHKRLTSAVKEMEFDMPFKQIVINDDLDHAAAELDLAVWHEINELRLLDTTIRRLQ